MGKRVKSPELDLLFKNFENDERHLQSHIVKLEFMMSKCSVPEALIDGRKLGRLVQKHSHLTLA